MTDGMVRIAARQVRIVVSSKTNKTDTQQTKESPNWNNSVLRPLR
jgi:hypothetical protein